MAEVLFRFYEELNEFLPPEQRKRDFVVRLARGASVGDAIDALGVPRGDVEIVLVNGRSVDFSCAVADRDRVAVYPVFEALDVGPLVRLRPHALRDPRFIVDRGLGALARLLRRAGFDAVHDRRRVVVVRRARAERRIVLSRDRSLFSGGRIIHGCVVGKRTPQAQLREVVARLQLENGVGLTFAKRRVAQLVRTRVNSTPLCGKFYRHQPAAYTTPLPPSEITR